MTAAMSHGGQNSMPLSGACFANMRYASCSATPNGALLVLSPPIVMLRMTSFSAALFAAVSGTNCLRG